MVGALILARTSIGRDLSDKILDEARARIDAGLRHHLLAHAQAFALAQGQGSLALG
jgi:hypothetical protein